MKALIAYLRLTFLITLISASTTYSQILESEPNNDLQTSDKIENGSSFSGQLYGREDTDFYSFDVRYPSNVDLKISLPTNSGLDYFSVRILDLKKAVYVGYTSGKPKGLVSTFISEPGTYFVVVEDDDYHDSRLYKINLNVSPIETSKADPTSSDEISANLEEKVVELEQKIDVLLKTITALNSLEDESTRAKNIEKLLDQVKGGSANEKQQLLQLEAENTELKNNIGHIARQVLELGNQLDKFSQASMLKGDASSSIDEQTERLESVEGARKEADVEAQRLQIALAARLAADELADERLSALEQREILLAEARKSLSVSEELSEKRANELIEAAKQQELLNQQVATLRAELGKLQELLALSEQRTLIHKSNCRTLGTA